MPTVQERNSKVTINNKSFQFLTKISCIIYLMFLVQKFFELKMKFGKVKNQGNPKRKERKKNSLPLSQLR